MQAYLETNGHWLTLQATYRSHEINKLVQQSCRKSGTGKRRVVVEHALIEGKKSLDGETAVVNAVRYNYVGRSDGKFEQTLS